MVDRYLPSDCFSSSREAEDLTTRGTAFYRGARDYRSGAKAWVLCKQETRTVWYYLMQDLPDVDNYISFSAPLKGQDFEVMESVPVIHARTTRDPAGELSLCLLNQCNI